MRLHYGKTVTQLKTFEQIKGVTATDTPLAAQTEITNECLSRNCFGSLSEGDLFYNTC
jgi:hypothetical protein